MSWSDDRTEVSVDNSLEKLDQIKNINGVLKQLAQDDDLSEYLKEEIVNTAIQHWTGKNRLPPEEASHLQNSKSVMYVFARFGKLQMACRQAKMGVPLDHIMQRLPKLKIELITRVFGEDIIYHPLFPVELYSTTSSIPQNILRKRKDGDNTETRSSQPESQNSKKSLSSLKTSKNKSSRLYYVLAFVITILLAGIAVYVNLQS